jgi:Cu(I)/Ag(I) efflux system membrane protein CusA/SilA
MNVRGRDVGGFVDKQKVVAERKHAVRLLRGVERPVWLQIRAKETLQVVIPIVLLIIFVLLYMTYHSAKEALHVVLAVPFALTGGSSLKFSDITSRLQSGSVSSRYSGQPCKPAS